MALGLAVALTAGLGWLLTAPAADPTLLWAVRVWTVGVWAVVIVAGLRLLGRR
jgi:hypothetical protein